MAAGSAFGQELITQKALSLDVAMAIAQGAVEKCRADGYRVSVTIVDGAGVVKLQITRFQPAEGVQRVHVQAHVRGHGQGLDRQPPGSEYSGRSRHGGRRAHKGR